MQGIADPLNARASSHSPPVSGITTTLYDLMEAIQEEVKPGEEVLVSHIVLGLMDRGHPIFPLSRAKSELDKT